MMTVISIIIYVFLAVFAIFGVLIAIEYLRYYKRKIVLKLNSKLNNEVKPNA